MGSSGSGHFGSYDVNRNSNSKSVSNLGASARNGESDRELDINDQRVITLEDVATLEYYQKNKCVPQTGSGVILQGGLQNKRMVVCDVASEMIIGNLPAKFQADYPAVLDGESFAGEVYSSSTKPIPDVKVIIYE